MGVQTPSSLSGPDQVWWRCLSSSPCREEQGQCNSSLLRPGLHSLSEQRPSASGSACLPLDPSPVLAHLLAGRGRGLPVQASSRAPPSTGHSASSSTACGTPEPCRRLRAAGAPGLRAGGGWSRQWDALCCRCLRPAVCWRSASPDPTGHSPTLPAGCCPRSPSHILSWFLRNALGIWLLSSA